MRTKSKFVEIKLAALNVGTMTGKARSIADLMKRIVECIFYMCNKPVVKEPNQRSWLINLK